MLLRWTVVSTGGRNPFDWVLDRSSIAAELGLLFPIPALPPIRALPEILNPAVCVVDV